MENLNVEQVKHCLECYTTYNCDKCTIENPDCENFGCIKAALALINSQEQRIKELAEENKDLTETVEVRGKVVGQLQILTNEIEEDNRKLTEENERLMREKTALECVVATARNQAKADTVRKMQERLKAKAKDNEWNGTICGVDIDQIAKEMLEGEING